MAQMILLCSIIFIPLSESFHLPFIPSEQRHHPLSHHHQALARPCTLASSKATATATTASHGAAAAACINEALKQDGDLNGLSRSELQGLCKKLNIRAVGRTNELVSRLSEALAHELQGTGGASLDGSSSTSRRNRLAARDILPEIAMGGANDGYVEQQLGEGIEAYKVCTSRGLSFMIHHVHVRDRGL